MDQKTIKRNGFYVFLLGTMAYMFSYIGRMNYSACLNSMVEDGLFTTEFGGYISTAYMIVYGSGQMINGVFGRRLPSKYMVFFGLFGAGLMNVLMGLVENKFAIMAVWASNGLFMSMLWAPIIKAFAEWIEEKTEKNMPSGYRSRSPAERSSRTLSPRYISTAQAGILYFSFAADVCFSHQRFG